MKAWPKRPIIHGINTFSNDKRLYDRLVEVQ
jgi:hypothetical protein